MFATLYLQRHVNLCPNFSQPVIDAFKVQQGKRVISWMRGRHIHILIILYVISFAYTRMSLLCVLKMNHLN